jgi:hypothetical protein
MKFYSTIKQVNLPRAAVESAWNFAKKVVSTIDYSDSNQLQLNKIKDDHFVSKLGEEACKIILSEFAEVKGPDYNIYDASQKSWSDDLYINKIGFAVKTQRRTNAMKYSLSWTFQSGEKRKDIILNKPEAWVVFVEYDDTHPYACYIYPPMQIKELIFGEPKLERLREHKKVVYASTLKFV